MTPETLKQAAAVAGSLKKIEQLRAHIASREFSISAYVGENVDVTDWLDDDAYRRLAKAVDGELHAVACAIVQDLVRAGIDVENLTPAPPYLGLL